MIFFATYIFSRVFSRDVIIVLHFLLPRYEFGFPQTSTEVKSCFHKFQASRETGALKEAKDKLEKKVEDLTWRLQFEKRLRVIC